MPIAIQAGATRENPDAGQLAVAFTQNQAGDVLIGDVMHSIGTNANASGRSAPNVLINWAVRRLTPLECTRLQGFPDNYFDAAEPLSDSQKYKMLGNSMAVNVMSWIGQRINQVQQGSKS